TEGQRLPGGRPKDAGEKLARAQDLKQLPQLHPHHHRQRQQHQLQQNFSPRQIVRSTRAENGSGGKVTRGGGGKPSSLSSRAQELSSGAGGASTKMGRRGGRGRLAGDRDVAPELGREQKDSNGTRRPPALRTYAQRGGRGGEQADITLQSHLPLSPAAAAAAAVLADVSTGGKRPAPFGAGAQMPRSGFRPDFLGRRCGDLPPNAPPPPPPEQQERQRRRQRSPSPHYRPAAGSNGRARTDYGQEQRWRLQRQRSGLLLPRSLGDSDRDAASGGRSGGGHARYGYGYGYGGEERGVVGAGGVREDETVGYLRGGYGRSETVEDDHPRLSSRGAVDYGPHPIFNRDKKNSSICTNGSTRRNSGGRANKNDDGDSPLDLGGVTGRAERPLAAATAALAASGSRGAAPFRCHPGSFAGQTPFIGGSASDTVSSSSRDAAAAAARAKDRSPLNVFSSPTSVTGGEERGHMPRERHPSVLAAATAMAAAAAAPPPPLPLPPYGGCARVEGERRNEMGDVAAVVQGARESSLLEMLGKGEVGSHRVIQAAVPLGMTKVPLQIMDNLALFFVDMRSTVLFRAAEANSSLGEMCLDTEAFEEAKRDGRPGGVIVCAPQFVKPSSVMEEAGIIDGDLITHINGKEVSAGGTGELISTSEAVNGVRLLDVTFLRATGESSAGDYPWHEAFAWWQSGVRRHMVEAVEHKPGEGEWMRREAELRGKEAIARYRLYRDFMTQRQGTIGAGAAASAASAKDGGGAPPDDGKGGSRTRTSNPTNHSADGAPVNKSGESTADRDSNHRRNGGDSRARSVGDDA
ncbi:unnamed protein product, partial [Scytosiphon promiscuus]